MLIALSPCHFCVAVCNRCRFFKALHCLSGRELVVLQGVQGEKRQYSLALYVLRSATAYTGDIEEDTGLERSWICECTSSVGAVVIA